jgi:hypothetical protein
MLTTAEQHLPSSSPCRRCQHCACRQSAGHHAISSSFGLHSARTAVLGGALEMSESCREGDADVCALPHFIAYALHRTKLHSFITLAALILLQHLVHFHYPTSLPTLSIARSCIPPSHPRCPHPPSGSLPLPHFVAYALHRTKLHSSITPTSLPMLSTARSCIPPSTSLPSSSFNI